jgi:hypothetical protein
MRIAILPKEIAVDLSAVEPTAEWAGLTAFVRPLDTEELAEWQDGFAGGPNKAALELVRRQLLRVEGATFGEDGAALDVRDAVQFKSLFQVARNGPAAVGAIFKALIARTTVDAVTEKNSGSPSASDGTAPSAA